jgi:hypothetical protein
MHALTLASGRENTTVAPLLISSLDPPNLDNTGTIATDEPSPERRVDTRERADRVRVRTQKCLLRAIH